MTHLEHLHALHQRRHGHGLERLRVHLLERERLQRRLLLRGFVLAVNLRVRGAVRILRVRCLFPIPVDVIVVIVASAEDHRVFGFAGEHHRVFGVASRRALLLLRLARRALGDHRAHPHRAHQPRIHSHPHSHPHPHPRSGCFASLRRVALGFAHRLVGRRRSRGRRGRSSRSAARGSTHTHPAHSHRPRAAAAAHAHSHRRHAHGRLRVASSVASADRRAAGHAARTVRVRRVILFSVERANRLLHGEFEPRVANFGGVLAPRVFVQAVVEIRGEIRAGEAPRRDVDVVEVEVEDAAVPELKKLLVLVGGDEPRAAAAAW